MKWNQNGHESCRNDYVKNQIKMTSKIQTKKQKTFFFFAFNISVRSLSKQHSFRMSISIWPLIFFEKAGRKQIRNLSARKYSLDPSVEWETVKWNAEFCVVYFHQHDERMGKKRSSQWTKCDGWNDNALVKKRDSDQTNRTKKIIERDWYYLESIFYDFQSRRIICWLSRN